MNDSTFTSSPQNPSALIEVINNWKVAVIDSSANNKCKSNQDLQKDAQTFFRYISTNTQLDAGSGIILQTRSSHEEALASLIQDLGPAFTQGSHPIRLRGLHVLLGAVEGCRESHISNGCYQLLGDFFLLQCGPIVDDDYEEDYDSLIRDTCVKALIALSETSAPVATPNDDCAEAIKLRCHFCTRGVERRCAAPDDMDQNPSSDPYGGDVPIHQDIRGGLSTLPRSKRSLCFDLLRSAVSGTSKINLQIEASTSRELSGQLRSTLQRNLIQFTEFLTRCIPGESDPRCLMQLLELLHAVQTSFQRWFQTVDSAALVFPHEDVFEAVVPYYPIQFTPPPNNIHGITRKGLHSELLAVLTCTTMDGQARKHGKPTMLGCSVGLFSEQLLPTHPDEDIQLTSLEKLEALDCISALLFQEKSNQVSNLTVDEVRSISQAVRAAHDEASLAVGAGRSSDEPNKVLANSCRRFVAKVASELETSNSINLWRTYVTEPLDKEKRRLQLSPARATTSIAYEACLCASGAPKTLRACLAKGLDPLINFLGDNPTESEDSLAAVHGMTAFFSSTHVALTKNKKEGVELAPHPMDPYAKKACNLLLKITAMDDSSFSFKKAAVTALEYLFQVSTIQQLESDDFVERICDIVQLLLHTVIAKGGGEKDEERLDYESTSSRVLGNIIGNSFDDIETVASSSIFSSEKIRDYVQGNIFLALKKSAFQGNSDMEKNRFDRQAMAIACSTNFELASTIVETHINAFQEALSRSLTDSATLSTLDSLSFLIRKSEGDNVVKALHESSAVDDLLDTLGSKLMAGTSARLRQSISQIALPATSSEQEELMAKVNAVEKIENGLRPAYNHLVPKERLAKLLKSVNNKIPPLSKRDEGDLFVRLPILSEALQSTSPDILKSLIGEMGDGEKVVALDLLKGLTSYSLSVEHLSSSRVAAASCVHGLLRSGFGTGGDCPTKPLVESVADALDISKDDMGATQNCLSFLSLLGQAAAIRGSSSSSTADAIARFLVEVACEDSATIPFDPRERTFCMSLGGSLEKMPLQIAAASAYGAMLVVDGIKPLIKQRLSHASLKFIQKTYESESAQAQQDEPVSAPSVGQLLVVCHLVCANDLSKFDRKTTHMAATVSVEGLSSDLFQVGKKMSDDGTRARILVICSVLKVICTAPSAVSGFVLTLVAGLLRAYAVASPDSEIGCKLVVLQALEEVTQLDAAKPTIIAVKPAVLSILASAMNQKSGLLRSTAVDVRNAWCLVE
ncbi:Dos2-interacting transcription regulator of RNA-Pol-II [Nitzschia inconspicua]|uniref:MMS19 nucleotide excision repair protein n=1 Tax=Nitzschia inconspicua TaxID=303405 RepID=A0A9K3PN85_9STRA|nr:Dos2-interacting transcription regulator of RNA-Pol-II [Nitzschia inconspicua]